MGPVFFDSPLAFRAWLEKNHGTVRELWVGYHKRATGKPSLTWPESVDEALCFGWIDGLRKSIDEGRYKIRFTPRKPRSRWSAINIARVKALKKLGRMRAEGLRAFKALGNATERVYSYEQRKVARLTPAFERRFRADKKAWAYFQSRPPSYRQTFIWWIVSAKKEETQERRLARLMKESKAERAIPLMGRSETK
jgi:uncharacterized protein YdeI (YjbR/CyaY-like superfamily)